MTDLMDDSTQLIIARIDRLESKLDTQYLTKAEHYAICETTKDKLGKLERSVYGTLAVVVLAVLGALAKLVLV